MSAKTIIAASVASAQNRVSGEKLIPAHSCQYPPAVDVCDLLLVNFDCNQVRHPGLYLFEEVLDGQVVRMGCRRFDVMPSGIKVDVDGYGDWQLFQGTHAAKTWRIAGYVSEVYKPASRLGQRMPIDMRVMQ